jgi:hypothetical protein
MEQMIELIKKDMGMDTLFLAPYVGIGILFGFFGSIAKGGIGGEFLMHLSVVYVVWSFIKCKLLVPNKLKVLSEHNLIFSRFLMVNMALGLVPRTFLYITKDRYYIYWYELWLVVSLCVCPVIYLKAWTKARSMSLIDSVSFILVSICSCLVLLTIVFILSDSVVGKVFLMMITAYPFTVYPFLLWQMSRMK